MSAATALQGLRDRREAAGSEPPAPKAVPVPARMRTCPSCGVQWLAVGRRATGKDERCRVCRDPDVVVVRIGHGRDEDDEEAATVPETRITQAAVDALIGRDASPVEACRSLGVTALDLATWCRQERRRYPGLPPLQSPGRLEALQREIDGEASVPGSVAGSLQDATEAGKWTPGPGDMPAPVLEAPGEAEPSPRPKGPPATETRTRWSAETEERWQACAPQPTAAALPAVPEPVAASPFRVPERCGGLVVPIRIEGSRLIVREPEVEGDVTDVEAELVLAWLRGRLDGRKGSVVEVEA